MGFVDVAGFVDKSESEQTRRGLGVLCMWQRRAALVAVALMEKLSFLRT